MDCPGEELNFLTTIFSRTLYHLSYRDFLINTNNTWRRALFVPKFQVKPDTINIKGFFYNNYNLGIVGIEPTYVLFQVKCFTSQPYTLYI